MRKFGRVTPPTTQPTLYLPHGGGPCFFMEWTRGPRDTWDRMAQWLRDVPGSLPATPTALLVVSAHWEAPVPSVTSSASPPLLYDYSGFPPSTYELQWPAPGSPDLAARVQGLLGRAGIDARADGQRGFDHGVFVPLKVAYPDPRIPTVQLSLRAGLDPAEHLAIGRALAPLRDEGVLIVGSGMSYHNMRGFIGPRHAGRIRPLRRLALERRRRRTARTRRGARRLVAGAHGAPEPPARGAPLAVDGRRRRRRSRPRQASPSRRGHGRRRLGLPVRIGPRREPRRREREPPGRQAAKRSRDGDDRGRTPRGLIAERVLIDGTERAARSVRAFDDLHNLSFSWRLGGLAALFVRARVPGERTPH